MIEKLENLPDLERLLPSAFACRILSAAQAYGMDTPFAQFWRQGDQAILCKLDDVLLLEAASGADTEELASFARMTGTARLACREPLAGGFPCFPTLLAGRIMERPGGSVPVCPAYEKEPSLREVHALLCDCAGDGFDPPEFEAFYMDLSHRIRHGTASCVALRQEDAAQGAVSPVNNARTPEACASSTRTPEACAISARTLVAYAISTGALAACACCPAKTDTDAVISGVAVRPELRRHGLGLAVVRALLCELGNRKAHVFCESAAAQALYRTLGFTDAGGFVELNTVH